MLAQIVAFRLKIVVRAWRNQLTFGIEKGWRLGWRKQLTSAFEIIVPLWLRTEGIAESVIPT